VSSGTLNPTIPYHTENGTFSLFISSRMWCQCFLLLRE